MSEHCGHPRPPQHGTLAYSSRRSFGMASRAHGRSARTCGSTAARIGAFDAVDSSLRALRLRGCRLSLSRERSGRAGESAGFSKTGEVADALSASGGACGRCGRCGFKGVVSTDNWCGIFRELSVGGGGAAGGWCFRVPLADIDVTWRDVPCGTMVENSPTATDAPEPIRRGACVRLRARSNVRMIAEI